MELNTCILSCKSPGHFSFGGVANRLPEIEAVVQGLLMRYTSFATLPL